jgi:predicted lipoprotein with Yx(FWY)xxD motif
MRLGRIGLLALPATLAVAAIVAGCGSSSSNSSSSSAPAGASTSATSTSASASAGASASARPVTITTKHEKKLGTILAAGGKELTVYLFEADKGSSSACSGQCAKFWPPVIGTGVAKEQAKSSDLGTVKRADGTTQVTYKGHPLYYFVKDKDEEDAYGQGTTAFGAGWYVLKPSGAKIDES